VVYLSAFNSKFNKNLFYTLCNNCGNRNGSGTGNDEYEELESSKKLAKISTPLFILFLTLAIFIPSRNTLIGMYVTKHITTNNIKKGLEIGKVAKEEIKKDVIDLINAITNKKEINKEINAKEK